ncbi:Lrp/AsnC family transcriptional regulator [Burkholderia sp. L27(2015)]|uniref:Lrp/AsnC family transcriptional regulator n=1 Tax=Burkholderia sp. L27(2015) TaxID=1641858 RepID=UPI00131ADFF8|nr:Lrp/AsnC family transcriptional regulator [Burkholderia sp. L27(2015)]
MSKFTVDEFDRKILKELVRDARQSNVELAKNVGMSTTPCWNRVKTLQHEKVIRRSTIAVDHAALGYSDIVIFQISLEKHSLKTLEDFGREMSMVPEVLEVLMLTGGRDFYVKVAISGTDGYARFLRERLYKIAGISHTESNFVLRIFKDELSAVI